MSQGPKLALDWQLTRCDVHEQTVALTDIVYNLKKNTSDIFEILSLF